MMRQWILGASRRCNVNHFGGIHKRFSLIRTFSQAINDNRDKITAFLHNAHLEYKDASHRSKLIVKECPFCHPIKDDPSNMYKLEICYEDDKPGLYYCHRCNAKGSWKSLTDQLSSEGAPLIELTRVPATEPRQQVYNFADQEQAKEYRENLWKPEFNSALDYCIKRRGINSSTLALYAVGCTNQGFKDDANNQWADEVCITFPSMTSKSRPLFFTQNLQREDEETYTDRIKLRSIQNKANQRILPSGGPPGLFGWHTIPEYSEEIVITEGEFDALAVYQDTGMPTVSVPNGCRSFPPALVDDLSRFKTIYLWYDADEPGRTGALKAAELIGRSRCKFVVTQSAKDANEALLKGHNLMDYIDRATTTMLPLDTMLQEGESTVDNTAEFTVDKTAESTVDNTSTNEQSNTDLEYELWKKFGEAKMIQFGKNKGKSYAHVFENDIGYAQWAMNLHEDDVSNSLKDFRDWLAHEPKKSLVPASETIFVDLDSWLKEGQSLLGIGIMKNSTFEDLLFDAPTCDYWVENSYANEQKKFAQWYLDGKRLLEEQNVEMDPILTKLLLRNPHEQVVIDSVDMWKKVGKRSFLKFGSHKGKTYLSVLIESPDYFKWADSEVHKDTTGPLNDFCEWANEGFREYLKGPVKTPSENFLISGKYAGWPYQMLADLNPSYARFLCNENKMRDHESFKNWIKTHRNEILASVSEMNSVEDWLSRGHSVVGFGKHSDLTFFELQENQKSYVKYLYNSYKKQIEENQAYIDWRSRKPDPMNADDMKNWRKDGERGILKFPQSQTFLEVYESQNPDRVGLSSASNLFFKWLNHEAFGVNGAQFLESREIWEKFGEMATMNASSVVSGKEGTLSYLHVYQNYPEFCQKVIHRAQDVNLSLFVEFVRRGKKFEQEQNQEQEHETWYEEDHELEHEQLHEEECEHEAAAEK